MYLGDVGKDSINVLDKNQYSHAVVRSNRCSRITWQFLYLVHKNFQLQFRRPIGTVLEFLLPILAVVFIVILRRFLKFKNERRCFSTFEPDQLAIPTRVGIRHIFYAPQTQYTQAVMDIVSKDFPTGIVITSHPTENEVLEHLQQNLRVGGFTACLGKVGIIFNNLDGNDITYTIRLRPEKETSILTTIQTSANNKLPGPKTTNEYLSSGFVQLQKVIGDAILKWKAMVANSTYHFVKVSVRQFPYPEHSIDPFLSYVDIILPLLFVLAFLYTAGIIVKELVQEKETRIREYMLMMGLKQWVLWATWFIKQFLFLMPPTIIIASLVKYFLFTKSDWLLIFVFLIFYIASMISFSFFVSVWFSSARVGLIIGFMAWFANFFPFLFLVMRYKSLYFGIIFVSSLLSNIALGFGIEMLVQVEQHIVGLSWKTITYPFTLDDRFNMAWVMGMLILDSIIYMAVA